MKTIRRILLTTVAMVGLVGLTTGTSMSAGFNPFKTGASTSTESDFTVTPDNTNFGSGGTTGVGTGGTTSETSGWRGTDEGSVNGTMGSATGGSTGYERSDSYGSDFGNYGSRSGSYGTDLGTPGTDLGRYGSGSSY